MIILRRPSRDYVTTVAELCGGRHMIVWRSSCNKNYYVLRTKIATPSQLCNETICKIKTAQGGLSVADGCRCLTKELDMIAC
jgi:hypothetical protein